jgi:serine phosphatase RsbU (regulator of sigma subunit)
VNATHLELQGGDTVVFYTDGVTEARTASGEMFGVDGLVSAVSACTGCDAAEVAQRIETSLSDANVERPRDDIAIVVVQVAGDGGTATARVPALAATE